MAEHEHTPPNPLPSITALGMALALAQLDYRRLDERTAGRGRTCTEQNTFRLLVDREQALESLISVAPAASLADVAVQIGVASSYASILECSDWSDPSTHERLHELHTALNRITLSTLSVVAAAAGLDLAAMAWDDVDALRASLFFGEETRA